MILKVALIKVEGSFSSVNNHCHQPEKPKIYRMRVPASYGPCYDSTLLPLSLFITTLIIMVPNIIPYIVTPLMRIGSCQGWVVASQENDGSQEDRLLAALKKKDKRNHDSKDFRRDP